MRPGTKYRKMSTWLFTVLVCESVRVCAGGVSMCVCVYIKVVNRNRFFFFSLQNGRAGAAALIRGLYMWQCNGVTVYVRDRQGLYFTG